MESKGSQGSGESTTALPTNSLVFCSLVGDLQQSPNVFSLECLNFHLRYLFTAAQPDGNDQVLYNSGFDNYTAAAPYFNFSVVALAAVIL